MVQRHIFVNVVRDEGLRMVVVPGAVRRLAQILGVEGVDGIGGEDGRRQGRGQDAILADDHGGAHRGVHVVHAIRRDGDITQSLAGCPLPQILDGSGLKY